MSDSAERRKALDVSRSFIVQAPAGSGKTELLTQRLLALLAEVDRPQQVLAITFTNKAAAEMRERLLKALDTAATCPCPDKEHERTTWELARGVLERHGTSLLDNPSQLAIQTIDSFNATLVRRMPWISRFGGMPEVSDDPDTLYRAAAEQLLARLERRDSLPLQTLLRHLDNSVAIVEEMLIDMLRRRDQWLGLVLRSAEQSHQELQQAIEAYCCAELADLSAAFPWALAEELFFCLGYAAANLNDPDLTRLAEGAILPGADFRALGDWRIIADFLLTATGGLRKSVTVKNGFPTGKDHGPAKKRMLALLETLGASISFVRRLETIRELPHAGYTAGQWQVLKALLELLPQLVAELWLVFVNRGQVDFNEIALKALHALGAGDNPSLLLLNIDQDLRHILVDEFQDTSRLQYRLLNLLMAGWTPGDGRTLFLVGDPMQSIYRFREAEVGLFLHAYGGMFGDGHRLTPLVLKRNFRSQEGIVNWVNESFAKIFPMCPDEVTGAVPLAEASAVRPCLAGPACTFHPFNGDDGRAEAEQIVSIVTTALASEPEQNIAVLVRSRGHLAHLLPLLRQHQIPYQAKDIDLLSDRPVARDLVHLTRSLLHRADRLSWLAVLRAPWGGLTLNDLVQLTTGHDNLTVPQILSRAQVRERLSADGQQRLERIWPVLQQAGERRGRAPLRALVESCWLALGGPACYAASEVADAQRVFDLLEQLDEGGDLNSFERLDRGLARLFAEPETGTANPVRIMTIHKAKGLEFDTVILPGLGRKTRGQSQPLLRWLDHPEFGLIMAPVSEKGEERDPLYRLVARLENEKEEQETARLLYVAATRAKNRLHLLGGAKLNSRGAYYAQKGSLLEKLWPVVANEFTGLVFEEKPREQLWTPPRLCRLPVAWRLPQFAPVVLPVSFAGQVPSETKQDLEAGTVFSGWENPVRRHVGSLVHLYLEKLARHGQGIWRDRERGEHERDIARQLMAAGVRGAELEPACSRVAQAVEGCLASARGCWLLKPHSEHACELPLSGILDGQLVHAVIDRTFVSDGVRWIVDYKSSTPHAGESHGAFLKREGEHYEKQLGMYAKLFSAAAEGLPIRCALYFPLVDGWFEYR